MCLGRGGCDLKYQRANVHRRLHRTLWVRCPDNSPIVFTSRTLETSEGSPLLPLKVSRRLVSLHPLPLCPSGTNVSDEGLPRVWTGARSVDGADRPFTLRDVTTYNSLAIPLLFTRSRVTLFTVLAVDEVRRTGCVTRGDLRTSADHSPTVPRSPCASPSGRNRFHRLKLSTLSVLTRRRTRTVFTPR